MIYVILQGRLGNNLWQIAAAATLAKKIKTDFFAYADPTYYCAEPDSCNLPEYIEQFKTTIFRKVKFVEDLPSDGILIEECILCNKHFEKDANYILKGFFAMQYDNQVVQELFEIDVQTRKYILDKYPVGDSETCAIVVRRGDYLRHIEEYAICTSFYKKAISLMTKSYKVNKFVCISDDINWCRQHLSCYNNITFVMDEPPLIDLYIISLCKHHIISNSSFAIWGVELSKNTDKIVIIPKPWFGYSRRGEAEKSMQMGLPSSWIRVRNISHYYVMGMIKFYKKKLVRYISQFRTYSLIL